MTESPYPMVSVDEALAAVLAQSVPLPACAYPLSAAAGHYLAADVYARESLPPFPAAVKDGYAVVAADGPGDYPVVGSVTAGQAPDFAVAPGSVAYITTGAPLPAGADAVVMVEETAVLAGGRVRIGRRVRAGADIRPVGVDIAAGEQLLAVGAHLGAAEIGLLATVGAVEVEVHPRPRVAVLSTGDELVEPGRPLGPGQIWDSNRAMLLAAVAAAGARGLDLGIAGDNQAQLGERIGAGLEQADLLLTSGGVSMGELDLLQPLLARSGRLHFGRVRMKPGKPVTFATVTQGERRVLVFALPGNPVSSLVTFHLFAMPALYRLAGRPQPRLPRVQAHLAQPLPLDPERPEYHRAVLRWEPTLNGGQGGYWAVSTGSQASSRLLSMRSANALLELPQGSGELAAGTAVAALWVA